MRNSHIQISINCFENYVFLTTLLIYLNSLYQLCWWRNRNFFFTKIKKIIKINFINSISIIYNIIFYLNIILNQLICLEFDKKSQYLFTYGLMSSKSLHHSSNFILTIKYLKKKFFIAFFFN